MVTLQGKSRLTIEATIDEMEFAILSRSDYEGASREQVKDFQEFVKKSVRMICHTVPEFVVPCEMARNAMALGADMVGTMSIDGTIVLEEVFGNEGGNKRTGNA